MASEDVCIEGAGYAELSKLQSWKIGGAVNDERQRKTESNKDKTEMKKIKEVVQGMRMKKLVIKEDTNQRKEIMLEKEREQKQIGRSADQHSKKEKGRNEEKSHGKEKMDQEPKHKGFNFGSFKKMDTYDRNCPPMQKIQIPNGEGTSELRVCGKPTTNDKEGNVTATSTKVLTSEAKVAGSNVISVQEGAEKIKVGEETKSVKIQSASKTEKLNMPRSYASVLMSPPPTNNRTNKEATKSEDSEMKKKREAQETIRKKRKTRNVKEGRKEEEE
ncbi:hypothetical protein Bca101_099717 [Brassica carinata]